MLAAMRTVAALLAAATLAGCASGSSSPNAAGTTPATATTPAAAPTTHFVVPTQLTKLDPCKLTAAEISAVVGFSVKRDAKNYPGQCQYSHDPGGHVWFSVGTSPTADVTRVKADEKFSLGGRYITITDETGFPHEALTAVKNPGNQSPGVIADFYGWLAPEFLKIRIYYPSGGKEPGRQHALTLAHKMLA
jgi:hypothetical protein